MRRLLQTIAFFCFITSVHISLAQETRPCTGFGFDVNAFGGTVLKHTEKFHLPVPELSTGMDVNLQWKTYGKKEWHQRRRYPTVGLAFTYTNYGLDSVYGRCFSVYPNIEIPLVNIGRLQWTVRIGNGAGFVTRHYSRFPYFDTLNNAVSSNLNDYFSFMTDIRFHINHHWDVQAGANFSHISNASYSQPNLGINLAGAHFGIKYFPVTSRPERIMRKMKPLSNRWLAQARFTFGFTGSNAPLGPSYPVYLVTGYASKRWISKNKAFIGMDYSFHESINSYLHNNPFVPVGQEAANSYKMAVIVGNEFLLGKVGAVLQVGYYIHQAFETQGKIYQKLGGNFYLVQREKGPIKEFFLCGYLKTHMANAELAEFGIGLGL
jgi:hypothetical protein